jgi:hypothetical protein
MSALRSASGGGFKRTLQIDESARSLRRPAGGSVTPRALRSIVAALMGFSLALTAAPAGAQGNPLREAIQVGLINRTFFPQPVFVAIQNGYFADEQRLWDGGGPRGRSANRAK